MHFSELTRRLTSTWAHTGEITVFKLLSVVATVCCVASAVVAGESVPELKNKVHARRLQEFGFVLCAELVCKA